MPNSLRDSLNAQDTVNQLRVSLNSPTGNCLIYILVEGPYDCCLYPKFFNESTVSFEYVGGGKGQVETALKLLQSITRQVLGICDADFRHLTKNYPSIPNLFFIDCHDIEMTMLNDNQTLINAFSEYRLQGISSNILHDAIDGSIFAAYTRWYNELNIIELKFKNFSILPYYDAKTKVFNSMIFLKELNKRSPNKKSTVSIGDINNFKMANGTFDSFNLCNGHDVITLAVAIIKTNQSKKNLSIENFYSVLRSSFTLDSFKRTKLYTEISKWQALNHYCILLQGKSNGY
jgi:GGDEF domain-containing protein